MSMKTQTHLIPSSLSTSALARRIKEFQDAGEVVALCDTLCGVDYQELATRGVNLGTLLVSQPDDDATAKEVCDAIRRTNVVHRLFVIELADPRIVELAAPFAGRMVTLRDEGSYWHGHVADLLADNWPGLGVDLDAEGIIPDLIAALEKGMATPGVMVHVWADYSLMVLAV